MRRITLWAASTLTIIVLLFSYRTSTSGCTATSIVSTAGPGTVAAAGGGTSSDSSGSSSDSSGSSSSSGSSGNSGSSAGQTVLGDAVSTRFGDVQVQITVVDGRITASTVTQVPWQDHRDQEINSRAVPILDEETVAAQSASIDMVSGATYTSHGYVESLQSAIDKANL
ncbi:FMN-binding protein [Knoellia aerolata]|uniref:FMN-binding protein n=1 Tax=Knoellia aerolata DSM 18566 TaxID=1385519 RepID=A0A0A0JSW6_9MICO|nr:FMN-binding protein [Knoellia aerolata]KGN40490.1 FMN-binding protein [Knoellia aerolata DSM 18566]